ncbi:hypothetical protein IEQ34_009646 [Dendrobium chrysotoxum]|uniref:Uncharacterized protein n=1 Tax=Dendrobium chrysotoxum TaxID=161865 RepID=A0AAV7GZB7_DENCH|nr:hypothetical protein IEQ34_009646 [Dendrobium chrysotoxum]
MIYLLLNLRKVLCSYIYNMKVSSLYSLTTSVKFFHFSRFEKVVYNYLDKKFILKFYAIIHII